ncbi:MAG TPA: glycosyltransferase family 4 protein [Tahibacter sp.]|uniref:glycosyltransferase family 4 protein n=1 Tax=Tahibacter sp. TaxID=2056211 RepID=UPI002C125047|nr:glycosyltransferase family 4 protein [Tahibacter sp.]HSX59135.1 glycosyltransferase family 4 protein [Tahibacter sp.]
MKIALLAPSLTAHDAVGTDVLEMGAALRRAGHEVRLYADHSQGIVEAVHAPPALDRWLGARDLVVYHYSIGWPRVEAQLATLNCRRVLRYHNITPPEFFQGWSPEHVRSCAAGRASLTTLATLGFDLALACSAYNLAELVAAGLPAGRGAVLAPFHRCEALLDRPADTALLDRYGDGRRNVLMLGRVAPNKGHAALFDAFACYRRHYAEDARLLVVGKHDRRLARYSRHLRERCAALGIADHVHFLDNVDDARLKSCWLVADALLMLSEHEGFCVPLVEAMALGVPVVARDRSAIGETLGGAGLLWHDSDPRFYAASLARLARDPAAAETLRLAGRERYRREFAPDVLTARLLTALAAFA